MRYDDSADHLVLAIRDELRRQCAISDASPPPRGFARFPSGWHCRRDGQGTAINLVDLAAAIRKVMA